MGREAENRVVMVIEVTVGMTFEQGIEGGEGRVIWKKNFPTGGHTSAEICGRSMPGEPE